MRKLLATASVLAVVSWATFAHAQNDEKAIAVRNLCLTAGPAFQFQFNTHDGHPECVAINASSATPTPTTVPSLPGAKDVTADQVIAYLKSLPPEVWTEVYKRTVIVTGATDSVVAAIFNSSRYTAISGGCDGYVLFGPGAHKSVSKWNSGPIAGRTVDIRHFNTWDGYCEKGITVRLQIGGNVQAASDAGTDWSKATEVDINNDKEH